MLLAPPPLQKKITRQMGMKTRANTGVTNHRNHREYRKHKKKLPKSPLNVPKSPAHLVDICLLSFKNITFITVIIILLIY